MLVFPCPLLINLVHILNSFKMLHVFVFSLLCVQLMLIDLRSSAEYEKGGMLYVNPISCVSCVIIVVYLKLHAL